MNTTEDPSGIKSSEATYPLESESDIGRSNGLPFHTVE